MAISRKVIGRIWVTSTLTLIFFLVLTPQFFIVWPAYGYILSIQLLKVLGPFNILIAFLLWNYKLASTTDPGTVPKGWQPRISSTDPNEIVEVKRLTGGPRWCRTCRKPKPPRAHHCRQCKRCILRMDHHCPWVNNCIGHYNFPYFLRFLFYVDIACSYQLWMITDCAFGSRAFEHSPPLSEVILLILNYTFCVPVLLSVGVFSIYHFYSLCLNTTTIEGWEKDRVATLSRRGKIKEVEYPYDLGSPLRNISSVLGSNPLFWCLPIKMPGNGLEWPIKKGIINNTGGGGGGGGSSSLLAQYAWPPRDPSRYGNDSHVPRSKDSRFLKSPSSGFTYGKGLNPNLIASKSGSGSGRRREGGRGIGMKSSLPPYHPDYVPPGEEEGEDIIRDDEILYRRKKRVDEEYDDEDSEDNRPLALTKAALQEAATTTTSKDNSPTSPTRSRSPSITSSARFSQGDDPVDVTPGERVRVRRGSEGYEVRPRFSGIAGGMDGYGDRYEEGDIEGLEEYGFEPPERPFETITSEGYRDRDQDDRDELEGGQRPDLSEWDRYQRYVPDILSDDEDDEDDDDADGGGGGGVEDSVETGRREVGGE